MLYLLMFSLSTLFIYNGEHIREKWRDRRKSYMAYFVGILLPIFMAGFRSKSVGIDVETYVEPMYQFAKYSNGIKHYYSLLPTSLSTRDLELGFTFVGYVATRLSNGLWGVFIAYELMIICAVFKSSLNFKKYMADKNCKFPAWLSMAVFYGLFYNMSLTMIRQSIACSLVLLGITEVLSCNKPIKGLLFIVLAITFHSTALIGIVFLIFLYISERKTDFFRLLYNILIGIAFIIFLLGGRVYWLAFNLLNRFIPIPARYLNFDYMWGQGHGVNVAWIYLILIALVVALLLNKSKVRLGNDIAIRLFLLIAIYSLSLFPLSIASANAGRVEYYFLYFIILLMPLIEYGVYRFKINGTDISKAIVILFTLVYWIGTVGLNDMTGTIHYILM